MGLLAEPAAQAPLAKRVPEKRATTPALHHCPLQQFVLLVRLSRCDHLMVGPGQFGAAARPRHDASYPGVIQESRPVLSRSLDGLRDLVAEQLLARVQPIAPSPGGPV